MTTKGSTRLLRVVTSFVIAMGFAAVTLGAQAQTSSLVYVESNISTANGNSVFGFSNDGLGNLTALPGSPYLTGGTGVATDPAAFSVDGDAEVIANPEGTLLFAVNGNSNNVSVFDINSDGSLTPVTGSPFASGGQEPISMAFDENGVSPNVSLMVVVNKATDPNQSGGVPSYTTFKVSTAGKMVMNPGSTWPLPVGSSPGQAIMQPNQRKFFGVEFLNNTLSSYRLTQLGIISQISQSTPPVNAPQTLGAVLHPTRSILYVGLPNQPAIAVYTYDAGGNLTYVQAAPNNGQAVCWLAVNTAGTRLYSAETDSGTITVYDLTTPKFPVRLQHFSMSKTNGAPLPTNVALDPSQQFLYVVGRNAELHVLNIGSDGTLSETISPTTLPVPPQTVPLGLAVLTK